MGGCGCRFASKPLQNLIRCAVSRRRVRTHAKAIGNRLELFGFVANAVPSAPPPCLVDERAVRGIHEPDDGLIDSAGEISPKLHRLMPCTESGQFRDRRRGLRRSAFRIGHENPDIAVAFFTTKTSSQNALALEF